MNKAKLLFISFIMLLMTGCMPTIYVAPDANKTVSANIYKVENPRICAEHGWEALSFDNQYNTRLPYGKRITLLDDYDVSNALFSYSCKSAISFIPKKNEKYYFDFSIVNGVCKLYVLRISPKNKYGYAREETELRTTPTCVDGIK